MALAVFLADSVGTKMEPHLVAWIGYIPYNRYWLYIDSLIRISSLVAERLYRREWFGVRVGETALDVFNGAFEAFVREEGRLWFLVGASLLDVVDACEHSIAPVLQHRQLFAQLLLCHHHWPGHGDELRKPLAHLRNSSLIQNLEDLSLSGLLSLS